MAKINKSTENEGTSKDEIVVSDITEIYNREWEEEPDNSEATKDLDEVDENIQEAVAEESDNTVKTEGAKQAPIVQDYVEPKILESTKRKNYVEPIHSDESILNTSKLDVKPGYQNTQSLSLPKKNHSKRNKIILFLLIIVFIAASVIAVLVLNKKSKNNNDYLPVAVATPSPTTDPANEAIDTFINAIRNKDKPESDALQTIAMQQTLKDASGVTSFYDYCQKNEYFCEQQFSAENLGTGNIKLIDYTAKDGTRGKQRIYTITKTVYPPNSKTGSKSVTTITIATVQVNGVWMIDYFNYVSTFGATNNL
jgi:hypothetical protein